MAPDARTAASDDLDDRLVGRTVANYRVLGRIGRGGMGAVYLAEHPMLQRYAAIKVLLRELSDNAELVARFMNEARATAQLRHGGFVQVFDSGKLPDGNAYLVMEYLRGVNLGAAIEWRQALTVEETLAVLHDVATSLSYAHKHGIVHRDLKPDNVFLAVGSDDAAGGERVTIKVLDFGIAKLNGTSGGWMVSAHTRTGSLLGTPLYMSPEQCRGAGYVDHRTDIYSLGCLAYHALTGQRPFPLEGFGEIIAAHLHQPPTPPRAIVPSLSESLERFVLWLLQKDPGARPQTMDEVVTALDQLRRAEGGAPPNLMALIPPAAMAPPASLFAVAPGPRVATAPLFDGERGLVRTPLPTAKSGDTRRLPSGTNFGSRVTISTLSGSAGEITPHWDARGPRPRPGRRVAIAAALVGGLASVVGLAVVLSGLGTHPGVRPGHRIGPTAAPPEMAPPPAAKIRTRVDPPASAIDPPASAPATNRPVVSAEPPVVAAVVTVKITSIPAGASVLDPKTTHVIGETPFGTEVPRSDARRAFILRKRGYRPKRLTVDASRNSDVTVTLDRRAAAATTTGTPDGMDEDDKRKL